MDMIKYNFKSDIKETSDYYNLFYSEKYIKDIKNYIYQFKNQTYIKRKKILLFLILYLTGIKIDKVLNLKVYNLKEFIESNSCLLVVENCFYLIKVQEKFNFKDFNYLYYDFVDENENVLLFNSYKNKDQPLRKNNILKEIQMLVLNFNIKYNNELNFDKFGIYFSTFDINKLSI